MNRLVLAIVMASACVHDSYRCHEDTDCTGVLAGRCEADGRCTQYDASCKLTQRSYVHADTETGACFLGQASLQNLCAPDQSPARPAATGCVHDVCETLPSCCQTGWTEACVIEAQRCNDVTCETRVAITASRGSAEFAVYDAAYDPAAGGWQVTPHPEFVNYAAFVAPAPGTSAPRLAGFTSPSTLAIDDGQTIALDPARDYHDITSVDFDRDLRDTIVLDWQDAANHLQQLTVFSLGDDTPPRDLDTGFSNRMSWGATQDETGFVDGFPDVVTSNANSYKILPNDADLNGVRGFATGVASTFDAANTNGAGGATHEFVWGDVDGDHKLDLVAFGNSIRVHTGVFSMDPAVDFDCLPPSATPTCALESVAFNGAILPGASPRIIAAPFASPTPVRELIAIGRDGSSTTVSAADPMCPSCQFEAVIVRDLDGDHQPDILAIDNALTFVMALSSTDPTLRTLTTAKPLAAPPLLYNLVRVSVSGTQR